MDGISELLNAADLNHSKSYFFDAIPSLFAVLCTLYQTLIVISMNICVGIVFFGAGG